MAWKPPPALQVVFYLILTALGIMGSTIHYERYLNSSQLEAVFYNDSPLLVLAGAGSGKTRVITYKIAYLINEMDLNPQNILAVTFTNKASNEMKDRVNSLLRVNVDVWIKTFHSAAANILRIMGNHFSVKPHFTIIDQQDQISIVRKIIRDLNIDPETYQPGKYAFLIDRAKDKLFNAEEAELEAFSTDSVFYDIYKIYEKKLGNENLLDFGDLIFKLTRGLEQNEQGLNLLKNRFRYILVDEFQDTNHAQYTLLKKLTHPEGNICVVGDEDQSIYGFRGARIENILSFSKDYKNSRIVKLEENYRSYQTILTASSHLINKNSGRFGKKLYTKKGEGEKIRFCRAFSDRDEAIFIAEEIQNLKYHDGYEYSDMAVFYRMNAQSRAFEYVFSRLHIPYIIIGGLRFYEREEIKDILAYLKLAINPMDEISLRRIANKPPRGIGEKTVDALVRSTIEKGYPIYQSESEIHIAPSRIPLVKSFLDFYVELKDLVHNTYPPQLLRILFDKSGYIEWLKDENKEEKVRNVYELYNAVEEYSKENQSSSISEFIEEVSLNQGGYDNKYQNNRVFLITLHNAKGLEFPVVFIAGMEEGIFPHYLSGESPADIQEERRLLYVGMTRAMEKLYLTAAKVRKLYGKSVERGLSNFVFELPEELVVFNEEKGTNNNGLIEDNTCGINARGFFQRRLGPQYLNADGEKKVKREPEIKVNNRVIHKHFGRGKVVEVENGVAVICFDDGKKMKFLLQYTPLEKEQ